MKYKDQPNLIERLGQYDSYLVGKITEEERISSEESLHGSIAADQRALVYRSCSTRVISGFS